MREDFVLLKTELLYFSSLISETVILKAVLQGTGEPERRAESYAT